MEVRPPADISNLGTILFVGAHPDDETFLCGGLLAAARKAGQRVICITATRGEVGVQNEAKWPAGTLGKTRSAELEAALRVLGVDEHHWLTYQDGACDIADQAEAAEAIAAIITACQPDTVLTFGPDGLTGHPDHQTVSAWTTQALLQVQSKAAVYHKVELEELYQDLLQIDKAINLYFMIDKPPLRAASDCAIYFELSPELVRLKLAALAAMPSQTEQLQRLSPQLLAKALGTEAFVRAA
jgi:LmbE family N-acetylglucosaminyl deacetylase